MAREENSGSEHVPIIVRMALYPFCDEEHHIVNLRPGGWKVPGGDVCILGFNVCIFFGRLDSQQ